MLIFIGGVALWIGLFVLLGFLFGRKQERREARQDARAERIAEAIRTNTRNGVSSQLAELARLRDEGVLTAAEFEELRQRLAGPALGEGVREQ